MNITIGKAITLAVAAAALSSLVTAAILKNEHAQTAPAPVVEAQVAQKPKEPDAVQDSAAATATPEIDLTKAMAERALGNLDAPITIIEYASMTCDHCAAFHKQVLPEVKTQLIDTGKARLIFRDMPWDKFALKGAKMARCAPPEKYFSVVEAIFNTHDTWAHATDPLKGLTDIGRAAGMEKKYLQACLDSEPLEAAILQKQKDDRETYDIKGTPFFIFMKDGERQESFPEFQEIFKRLGEHKH